MKWCRDIKLQCGLKAISLGSDEFPIDMTFDLFSIKKSKVLCKLLEVCWLDNILNVCALK